jgi:hypothetical protein
MGPNRKKPAIVALGIALLLAGAIAVIMVVRRESPPAVPEKPRANSGGKGQAVNSDVSDLVRRLDDPEPEARESAARSLGKLGPAAHGAKTALLRLYKNDLAAFNRKAALYALVEIDPDTAAPLLVSVVKGGRNVAGRAGSVLLYEPADKLLPFGIDEIERCLAVEALGKIRDRHATPVLVEIVKRAQLQGLNPDWTHPRLFVSCARALGDIGVADPDVIASLQAAVRLEGAYVPEGLQIEADTALRKLGKK